MTTSDRTALIARAEEMFDEGLYDFELVKLMAAALSETEEELADARASIDAEAEFRAHRYHEAECFYKQQRAILAEAIEAIREWNTLTNGRARYRDLDRLVNPEAWIDPDATSDPSREEELLRAIFEQPTESKEPDMHDPKNNVGLYPGSEW
jgi:hypothetical protein